MTTKPKCSQWLCDLPADVKYQWLGEIRFACIQHANGVQAIGRALGMNVIFEPIGDPRDDE